MFKKCRLVLAFLLVSQSLFWSATSCAANFSSDDLKNFANNATLTFSVITNFDADGEFTGQVSVHNQSATALPPGNSGWKIYIHSVRRILSTDSTVLSITRLQGDLYEIAPTKSFGGLNKGETLELVYTARGHIVSYSDFMPRAFIANSSGQAAVFVNTNTENLHEFVAPFVKPEQFLRFNTPAYDLYGVVTNQSRYESNLALMPMPRNENTQVIIPTPKSVKYSNGAAIIDNDWIIVESGGLTFESDYLRERLHSMGLDLNNHTGGTKSGNVKNRDRIIELVINNDMQGKEKYELNITATRATVSASTSTGIFYGVQSLLSLFPATRANQYSIPALRVFDEPRFSWRGMHYDIARNFHGKSAVVSLIEQMGRYKLNRLHLHLTDDEGWRLEIPGLPELTEIGAHRCFDLSEQKCLLTQLGAGPDKSAPGNGYLTSKDFIEIVRYAAQRHIEIIPEIDMPGHARAAVKSMQARFNRLNKAGQTEAAKQFLLSDPDDKSQYLTVQSYSDNSINVCLPSTYVFVEKVVYELQQMYRQAGQKLERFHMGGDEVGHGSWANSPACEQLFKTDSSVVGVADLKPYFVRKVSEITAERGLDLIGWEDGLMYDPSNAFVRSQFKNENVIANAWDNIWEAGVSDRAYRLANENYGVIISASTHLYFDHPHEANANERGYHWATRYTDLEKVFYFMPDNIYANADRTFSGAEITNLNAIVGRVLTPLKKPQHILGIQGQVWSETIRTSDQLQKMVFPRLLALAERAWFEAEWEDDIKDKTKREKDWNKFVHVLVDKELPKLAQAGVEFYLPPPGLIKIDGALRANSSLPGSILEYSLDNGQNWITFSPNQTIADQLLLMRTRIDSVTSRTIKAD